MNKKKEKTPYADLSVRKITATNKPKEQPKGRKILGGDLRARNGK